jgi:hypothetical protein
MKYRIAMWASAGFLVAGFWALYFSPTAVPVISAHPSVWTLARLTCPIVPVGFYFHFAIGVFGTLLANSATYGLVGLIVETLRHRLRHKLIPAA